MTEEQKIRKAWKSAPPWNFRQFPALHVPEPMEEYKTRFRGVPNVKQHPRAVTFVAHQDRDVMRIRGSLGSTSIIVDQRVIK